MINPSLSVEAVGYSMFEALAHTFPVACATDEFFYFPQVRLPEPQWSTWDCFSSETVAEFVRRLSAWEDELDTRVFATSIRVEQTISGPSLSLHQASLCPIYGAGVH